MSATININDRVIGPGHPTYVVAEMSANHNQDFNQAVQIIRTAKECGADAVKIQTYTPDTITINCDNQYFRIGKGTIWEGQTLYELYKKAYTPLEWHPKLKEIANDLGIELFSTPFDKTAVDLLESLNIPAYKISSFELIDIPLIQNVSKTGKPIIMSTGMATLAEIDEAVTAAREAGCKELALLKCTSAYPSDPADMNLRTIPHMALAFNVPVGLSDHSSGIAVPIVAVALGSCIIEKHLTISRSIPGPDSAFSLEPHEFEAMVKEIRTAEKSLGRICYEISETEHASRIFRRSLFIVKDMREGEVFSEKNIRSIRPGHGLHPRYLGRIIGKKITRNASAGIKLDWDLIR